MKGKEAKKAEQQAKQVEERETRSKKRAQVEAPVPVSGGRPPEDGLEDWSPKHVFLHVAQTAEALAKRVARKGSYIYELGPVDELPAHLDSKARDEIVRGIVRNLRLVEEYFLAIKGPIVRTDARPAARPSAAADTNQFLERLRDIRFAWRQKEAVANCVTQAQKLVSSYANSGSSAPHKIRDYRSLANQHLKGADRILGEVIRKSAETELPGRKSPEAPIPESLGPIPPVEQKESTELSLINPSQKSYAAPESEAEASSSRHKRSKK